MGGNVDVTGCRRAHSTTLQLMWCVCVVCNVRHVCCCSLCVGLQSRQQVSACMWHPAAGGGHRGLDTSSHGNIRVSATPGIALLQLYARTLDLIHA